jgi:hypothetical protein
LSQSIHSEVELPGKPRVIDLLQAYARRVRELRRANADVPETGLAPAFQQLLDGLIPLLPIAPRLTVVPEYRNPGVGRPDIALVRQGAFARAFVELKAPAKPADPTRWRAGRAAVRAVQGIALLGNLQLR